MKIWIASDVHQEQVRDLWIADPVPVHDLAVLAGDIHGSLEEATLWAGNALPTDKPIVMVAGNHEFYGNAIDRQFDWVRQEPLSDNGIHLLENSEVIIDGVRFLGCVWWTGFDLYGPENRQRAMVHAKHHLNDYKTIDRWDRRESGEVDPFHPWKRQMLPRTLLSPKHTAEMHAESTEWLRLRLAEDMPTVVVTHTAPHELSIHPRYSGGDWLTPAFVNHYPDMFEERPGHYPPMLWVHGHVHDAFDYIVGKTRVICNPRGYPQHNPNLGRNGFQDDLVVEI